MSIPCWVGSTSALGESNAVGESGRVGIVGSSFYGGIWVAQPKLLKLKHFPDFTPGLHKI
jgi:hypothetical protein